MKKFSWIVALLLALSLSALFISCGVDPIITESKKVTYTEVKLGAMNIWAGDKEKQQGWATGEGFKFKGVGDKPEVAKDLKYSADDFHAAAFLEFELVEGAPKYGTEIIWGAPEGNEQGISGWNSTAISDGTGKPDSTKGFTIEEDGDKRIAKIELKKALANYGVYKNAEQVKIILQHWGGKGIEDMVVPGTAKLLIPDTPEEFVPITGIELVKNTFYWTGDLKLEAKFTPEEPSKQLVIWAIKSYQDPPVSATVPGTIYSITGNPDKPDEPEKDKNGDPIADSSYNDSKGTLLSKVNFVDVEEEEVEFIENVWPNQKIVTTVVTANGSKDTISLVGGNSDSVGAVITVVAIVREGGIDGADKIQDLKITVIDPPAFTVKVGSTNVDVNTYNWGGDGAALTVAADKSGFTYTADNQNYQANFVSFRVDLGAGEKLSNFKKVTFTFEGTKGDVTNKPLQLWARATSVTSAIWSDQPVVGHQVNEGTGDKQYVGTGTDKKENLTITIPSYGGPADWNMVGDDATESKAKIDANLTAADAAGRNVWFVIYLGGKGDDPVEYSITNIVFSK